MKSLYPVRKSKSIDLTSGRGKLILQVICVLVLFLLAIHPSFGQIAVSQNASAQSLAQLLSGTGVTISNYSKTCDADGTATFTTTGTNLGIGQGIVLSSGRVQNIGQAANNFASSQFSNSADPQLSTLTSGSVFDKCILEFDIVPQGSTLKFDYVFASEEYPEFVCSPYNDVFGFFISGPNPGGGNYTNKNLATLPSSTTPVCINTVNPGVSGTYQGTTWNSGNCQSLGNTGSYVNNQSPNNPNIVYDGMTTVLTATANVVPCQTYHLKIAIADVGDRIYDSGVFLEAYSFTSAPYTVSISAGLNYPGYTDAYEGCVNGVYTVSLSSAQSSPITVNLVTSGTATSGTDYTALPTSVVIPAGQTSVTVPLTTILDNITEGAGETVIVSIANSCAGTLGSAATITIKDNPQPGVAVGDTTLCRGQSTQLSASGATTYAWSPTAGLSNANIANPIATPTVTTTYTVTMTLGACVKTMSPATIVVSNPSIVIISTPKDTICTGGTIPLTATASGGIAPYAYVWGNSNTTNSITVSATGTYTVSATDAFGCTANTSKSVIISNLAVSGTVTNVSCFGNTNGAITVTATGGHSPFTYNWSDGPTTQNRSNIGGGTYTVTANNTAGCTATATFTVVQPSAALSATAIPSGANCNGTSSGGIIVTTSGGVAPYRYVWNGGDTTKDRTNLAAANYIVTITDAGNCIITRNATVTEPAAITINETPTNTNCFGGSNGTINITVTGGTGAYSYTWSNTQTTQNITSLAANSYTVTVKDGNNCPASKTIVITQPPVVTALPTPTNPSCTGLPNGSVNLSVSGGTAGYTYLWNNSATTQNITGLPVGTYTATVTDTKGCTDTVTATLTQSGTMSPSTTKTDVSCFGGNNGSISVSITGGTAPYTYNWGGGITSQNRSNVAQGTYTVTITDNISCTITASATISQPAQPLAASVTPVDVLCFGGNNGSINLTATGGTSPYTYNWGSGITTQNRTNLTANSYTVTVTDNKSCTATATTNVGQPAAALSASAVPVPVSCFGGSNGTITVTTAGGTTPYNYKWNDSTSTQNRSGLIAGSYQLTVTDANLCTTTASSTINQPGTPVSAVANPTHVSCYGGNNGGITLTTTGGTTPYTYNWGNSINSQNRSNLTAGNYSVTITDFNSCSTTATASITEPASALGATLPATHVACFGASTGSISLTASGGTAPYSYNWGSGITTQNRTNLVAGNYTVTVTDNKSCSFTATATVTQPAAALDGSTNITHIGCFNANTGSIALTATGGTAPYTYNWGNNITTQNRSTLTAGTYQVVITDNNQCMDTVSATVNQTGTALTATTLVNNVSCYSGNNGSITLTTTGGSTPYTYNWGNNINTQNRTNLIAGNYSVTITDINSCSTTATASVTEPTMALSASVPVTHVACFGASTGSITLTATGGTAPYTYNWGGGITTQNRTALAAGSYSVTVTDSKSCSVTTSATVNQPTSALAASPFPTAVSCFSGTNGSIVLTVSGGTTPYAYNWGNGITTKDRHNLTAGNYNVTITDANTCTATVSASITQPAAALTSTYSVVPVSCFGGSNASVNITATGGTIPYSYDWGNNVKTNSRSNLAAGNYNVTINDSKGCVTLSNVVVTQPAVLALAPTPKNVSCFGAADGRISINVSGGIIPYSYKWNNGPTTKDLNGLAAGTYTVEVVDSNNCSITTTATIVQPTALVVNGNVSHVKCYDENTGNVLATVTGGTVNYKFTWSNSATTQNITNLRAGTYTLTVTDANSCAANLTRTVTEPAAITIAETHTDAPCNGSATSSITVSATGGTGTLAYKWNNNSSSQQLTGLTAGSYTLTVTDSNLCATVMPVIITEPAVIKFSETHTNLSCNKSDNGSIQVTVTGGVPAYSYNWSNGDSTKDLTNLKAGLYSLTIADANHCHASLNAIILSQPDSMTSTITSTDVLCYGTNTGKADAVITGGTTPYNFNWSNGTTTEDLANTAAGSYQLTITDINGCSQTATTTINTIPGMQYTAATGPLVCANAFGDISFEVSSGTPPYTFNWSNGAKTQHLNHVHPGTYSVTVLDANKCAIDTTITITNLNSFDVIADGGGTIKLGETIELTATSTGSDQTTYTWSPTYNISCVECPKTIAQPGETTIYTVIGVDTNGCTAQDTVMVEIISDHTLFTPNAFTPNGDGNNDEFQIFGNLDAISKMDVMIFDRWGEKVFESNAADFKWDGTFKGEKMMPGVFVYVMKVAYLDTEDRTQKGSVTLIR